MNRHFNTIKPIYDTYAEQRAAAQIGLITLQAALILRKMGIKDPTEADLTEGEI